MKSKEDSQQRLLVLSLLKKKKSCNLTQMLIEGRQAAWHNPWKEWECRKGVE